MMEMVTLTQMELTAGAEGEINVNTLHIQLSEGIGVKGREVTPEDLVSHAEAAGNLP